MMRRIFRRPWSLAALVVAIILLAAAVLVAQPGEGSLFGAVPGGVSFWPPSHPPSPPLGH